MTNDKEKTILRRCDKMDWQDLDDRACFTLSHDAIKKVKAIFEEEYKSEDFLEEQKKHIDIQNEYNYLLREADITPVDFIETESESIDLLELERRELQAMNLAELKEVMFSNLSESELQFIKKIKGERRND